MATVALVGVVLIVTATGVASAGVIRGLSAALGVLLLLFTAAAAWQVRLGDMPYLARWTA